MDETQAYNIAKQILKTDQIVKAPLGRNNWVFLTADRVISMPRDSSKTHYAVRVAIINFLQENGIPTTPVLDYSTSGGIEYVVTARVPGCNVDLRNLTLEDQLNIHRASAEVLGKMHTLRVKKFGKIDSTLVGSNDSWKDFVIDYFEEGMRRLYLTPGLNDLLSKRIRTAFDGGLSICERVTEPVFLHGDFHIGNLLFDNLRVAAVIDLDIPKSGDVAWDTAHYSHTFNLNQGEGLSAFREVYDHSSIRDEDFYAMIIWTMKIGSQGIYRPEDHTSVGQSALWYIRGF